MTPETDETGGHQLKIRSLILPAVLFVALAGCTPGTTAPVTPTPTPSSSASQPTPSVTPSTAPTVAAVAIPADCEALVSTSVVHREFSPQFVPVAYVPHPEDEVGLSFDDRNGLNCIWAIPRSEGFVSVHVAERATASDAEQIADWRSAGFSECTLALDACFATEEETMVNIMQNVYALAGGFELRVTASASSDDALLVLASEAATNMGYR